MSTGTISDGAVSRAEHAAARITEFARAKAPGARLGTKNEMRDLCGVSPGSFNEALRLLRARGQVVARPGPGGGLFVAEQSPLVRLGNSVLALDGDRAAVADAVRIRDALDPLLLADAIWHSSPADVAGYREQITAMAAAVDTLDVTAFLHANWRLHTLIAEVNPSEMLRSMYTTLLDLVEGHTLAVLPVPDRPLEDVLPERHRIHADLVDAIADRDADRVARLAAEHSVTVHHHADEF